MTSKRRSLLEWERDAIVAGYFAGEKEDALAAEFGVSVDYPHKLARRRGVPRRSVGRPRKRGQVVELRLDISVQLQLPSRAAMVPAVCREDREGQQGSGTICAIGE